MSFFEIFRDCGCSCVVVVGVDLCDDLLNMAEAGPNSPLGIGAAFLNCFVGGNSRCIAIGGSAALLDRMLEKDIGFEAFASSTGRG